jgi:transcriptional regulator with XRE-family HTH domain
MAAKARLDAKHYQQLEYGSSNATFATLKALARALGVTLSEMLEGV